MGDKKDSYKWRLTTYGREDTLCFRKAFEHIQTFHIVKNSEARIIDYDEYQDLIKKGEIRPAQSHWQIKENQIGIISLTEYEKYSNDWTTALFSLRDFISGWRACEYEIMNTKH